jgi:hypothetical protein
VRPFGGTTDRRGIPLSGRGVEAGGGKKARGEGRQNGDLVRYTADAAAEKKVDNTGHSVVEHARYCAGARLAR